MERLALYEHINTRVYRMLARGHVEEVLATLGAGFDPLIQALQIIGHGEVIGYLDEIFDKPEMPRLIRRNSRLYAKSQRTCSRQYSEFAWIRMPNRTPVSGESVFSRLHTRLILFSD